MASVILGMDRRALAAIVVIALMQVAGLAEAQHQCVPPLKYVHDGECTTDDKTAAENGNCTVRLEGNDKWCCCEPSRSQGDGDGDGDGSGGTPPPPAECVSPTTKVHDGSCTQDDIDDSVEGNCTDRYVDEHVICCCEVDKDAGGCGCAVLSSTSSGELMLGGLFLLVLSSTLYWRSARRGGSRLLL